MDQIYDEGVKKFKSNALLHSICEYVFQIK